MTSPDRRVLLSGLPSSGKTTFLAALWYALTEPSSPGTFHVRDLTGERSYLNSIRRSWLELAPVARTSPAAHQDVTLYLKNDQSGATLDLYIPDLAGESFERYLTSREWPQAFHDFISTIDGVLLFAHPNHVHPHRMIREIQAAVPALSTTVTEVHEQDMEPETSWNYALIPTQVQLVDLLQLLHWAQPDSRSIAVAVIISAWDLVAARWGNPVQWLSESMPLLYQYLKSIHAMHPWKVFGLSAQGGDLNRDRERLAAVLHSGDRIFVTDGATQASDITLPLRWMLGN